MAFPPRWLSRHRMPKGCPQKWQADCRKTARKLRVWKPCMMAWDLFSFFRERRLPTKLFCLTDKSSRSLKSQTPVCLSICVNKLMSIWNFIYASLRKLLHRK
ncbi:hypothetical protein DW175_10545 [Bacteroides sp. AM16-15]|nr:hypothetical protein DW175_10545 [Bacteroides sp. AM16-15]